MCQSFGLSETCIVGECVELSVWINSPETPLPPGLSENFTYEQTVLIQPHHKSSKTVQTRVGT